MNRENQIGTARNVNGTDYGEKKLSLPLPMPVWLSFFD
jgi:hypothetical protein